MLPAANRLRSSKDFARITKTGHRSTSQSLVVYACAKSGQHIGPQVGLIINKSVGGSVARHRIARQLRHGIKEHLELFPTNTQIVIRVLRPRDTYQSDLVELVTKLSQKFLVSA